MSTTNKWLIGIGVVLLLVAMYALPFVLQSTAPAYGGGYGMMGGGRGGMMGGDNYGGMMGGNSQGGMMAGNHQGGMMGGGYNMLGYNNGFFSVILWLLPLSLLVLIGLASAALIKYLRAA